MSARPFHLVIVDDDDDIRHAVETVARETFPDADIASYNACVPAIKRIKTGTTDLLITNCHMPDMDGPTLVRKLRAEHHSLPIVMVSASEDARQLGEDAGIDRFVKKCELTQHLPAALRNLLPRA